MISILLLSLLIGMRHALEADHLAAVASISAQTNSIKASIKHGAVWGLGHTTTLFLFGSIAIWMDTIVPEEMAYRLEFAVGIMLVILGFAVIRRVIKDRIHYHFHKHADAEEHFHAHSHAGEGAHKDSEHKHQHSKFPYRTLLIGFMHGMAGSAALVILTLETMKSVSLSMIYMLLFGIGSLIGMAAISVMISIPLRATKGLTWFHNGLQGSIGVITIGFGLSIIIQSPIYS